MRARPLRHYFMTRLLMRRDAAPLSYADMPKVVSRGAALIRRFTPAVTRRGYILFS